jgi:hypothetical protein
VEDKFLDFITKGPGLILIVGLLIDAALLTTWQQVLMVVTK